MSYPVPGVKETRKLLQKNLKKSTRLRARANLEAIKARLDAQLR